MYKFVFVGLQVLASFKLLWKAKCMPRIKFFAWLMLMDQLNTKDMLQWINSNVQSSINCVFCHEALRETRDHFFFDCVFTKHFWSLINIEWPDVQNIHDKILTARQAWVYVSSWTYFSLCHGKFGNYVMQSSSMGKEVLIRYGRGVSRISLFFNPSVFRG